MIARDAMTTPVVTVPRSASVRQAVRLLYERGVPAAPVLDEAGGLAGMVSDLDLLRGEFTADPGALLRAAAEPGDPPSARVADVMITEVRTAEEDTDLAELTDLIVRDGVPGVPVLRASRIVGMLGRRELMRALFHSDARVRDDVLRTIRDCFPGGPQWAVTVSGGVVSLQGVADRHAARAVRLLARTIPGVVRVLVVDAPHRSETVPGLRPYPA